MLCHFPHVQIRRHRVNIDGDVCTVIITTLVLEVSERSHAFQSDISSGIQSVVQSVCQSVVHSVLQLSSCLSAQHH